MRKFLLNAVTVAVLISACVSSLYARSDTIVPGWVKNGLSTSVKQAESLFENVKKFKLLPRSIQYESVSVSDWTSGFYPGLLWYLYEYTGDESILKQAEFATNLLAREQYNADNHDIGFKMYCSYGNGYILTGKEEYRNVIIRSAKTLSSRYSYKTGLIMSWDSNKERDWKYPVIIDNMMNLELTMEASKMSADTMLRHIAVSHADKTMKYHYRENYSCPHVVDYDSETGVLRKFDWNNGSNDVSVSTWGRGQSWGLYGFTMMYRETGYERYLQHAEKIADFLLNHENMPEDLIPYWDYTGIGRSDIRDASAAAIMASALIELSVYSKNGKFYFSKGEQILKTLSSDEYLAKPGTHHNFIIKNAIGNYLRNSELEGALNYADYYYVEALLRYIKLLNNKPVVNKPSYII